MVGNNRKGKVLQPQWKGNAALQILFSGKIFFNLVISHNKRKGEKSKPYNKHSYFSNVHNYSFLYNCLILMKEVMPSITKVTKIIIPSTMNINSFLVAGKFSRNRELIVPVPVTAIKKAYIFKSSNSYLSFFSIMSLSITIK